MPPVQFIDNASFTDSDVLGLAQAQDQAYIPYMVIVTDHFQWHNRRHWVLKSEREISSGIVQIPLKYK